MDSFSDTEMLEEYINLCVLVLSKFQFTEPIANGNIQETVEKTGEEFRSEVWIEE